MNRLQRNRLGKLKHRKQAAVLRWLRAAEKIVHAVMAATHGTGDRKWFTLRLNSDRT